MPSYSMYASQTGPAVTTPDNDSVVVGIEFYVTQPCTLDAIRWWQCEDDGRNWLARRGGLFVVYGGANPVAMTPAAVPATEHWNELRFTTPVPLDDNEHYIAGVLHPQGRYASTSQYYGAHAFVETNGPLVVIGQDNAIGPGQNCFIYETQLQKPQGSFNASKYWVDVVVTPTAPGGGGGSVDTFTSSTRFFGTTYAAGDALPPMSPSVKRSLLKRGRIAPASLTAQRPFKAGGVSYAAGAAWPAGADPKVLRRLLRSGKIG